MSKQTYPQLGFPKTTETTSEDWVPIDGQWHNLVYVHHPHGAATDLYVDGKLVPASGEMEMLPGGPRAWDWALSREQVELQYAEAVVTKHADLAAAILAAKLREVGR